MSQPHYQNLELTRSRVHAWGERAALHLECPHPGILRLRQAPASLDAHLTHPALPPRDSFAVLPSKQEPLDAHRTGDTLHVRAPGVHLSLDLRTGTWDFGPPDAAPQVRSLEVTGTVEPRFPLPQLRTRLVLEAPPGEAYLGFGEKVGPLDKRGMRLVFWNTDVLPHAPDTDPLYVSIPFTLGLGARGAWGLLVDAPGRSEVDVAQARADRVTWELASAEVDAYLLAGPTPADVLARYGQLTGRMPLPPLWALGMHQSRWGYEGEDDVRAVIAGYRTRGLPLDCVHLDVDHMDGYRVFTWDAARFPAPRRLAEDARGAGVRLVTIVDPGLKADAGWAPYDEALARGLLVRSDRGEVLRGAVWPKPCVFPDFTRPEVRRFWAEHHRALFEAGVAGIWNDMNEPSVFSVERGEAVAAPPGTQGEDPWATEGPTLPGLARHGARRHRDVHNAYANGMAEATRDAFRTHAAGVRPFVLTRAGYAGIQRTAAVWTGDNSSHWAHLEASLPMLCGLGLSGVAFCGVDVPGFLGRPSAELLVRWMQAGTFYPFLRNHSARGTPGKEPWRFGEEALRLVREALERRYRLLPTLYTLLHEAHVQGWPALRPLCFHFPEDADAVRAWDQVMLGESLLVAPVVRPGQTRRLVYLPRGRWRAWPSLGELGEAVEGPVWLAVEAPLDTVPVWLREGGAVALTQPALHTTGASWATLTWHVHAGPEVRGVLYEDAGDGDGPSRVTWLRGGRSAGRFVLERQEEGALPSARAEEHVRVAGLDGGASVQGASAHRWEGGLLTLTLPAGWTRVEVS